MTSLDDRDRALARLAAEVAMDLDAGRPVEPAIVSGLRAIALTRDECRRREAAAHAEHLAGVIGQVALDLLRFGIYALA